MTGTSRVALVTGASAGIGRACAGRLAAAGWAATGASRRGTGGTGWTGLVMDVDDDATVPAGAAGTAYAAALRRAVGAMERDEASGAPAALVARTVQRVLEASRAPRRVSVGKAGKRVGLIAKRLLPFRVFEAAANGSLGVD